MKRIRFVNLRTSFGNARSYKEITKPTNEVENWLLLLDICIPYTRFVDAKLLQAL